MTGRKAALLWLPVLLYAALILAVSSRSSIPVPAHVSDKLLHLLEYFIFGLLLLRAVRFSGVASQGTAALVVLAASALFGAFDEYYQSFTPGRSSSAYDWLADCAGVLLLLTLRFLKGDSVIFR